MNPSSHNAYSKLASRRVTRKRIKRDRWRAYVHPDDFKALRDASFMTRQQAASVLGVSVRTVGNWEAGKARIPYAAFKLLRILKRRSLGDLHRDWDGFCINGRGRLVTPEQREFDHGGLSGVWLLAERARFGDDARRQLGILHAGAADGGRLSGREAAPVSAPSMSEANAGLVLYKTT